MNLQTKYGLNETVYAVRDNAEQRIVKCNACNNTGRLMITGEEFVCPKCKGQAHHPVYSGQRYYVYDSGMIGRVEVRTTSEDLDRYFDEEKRMEINYMLDCTGVGSGQIWKEHELFPSREEAQRFCDEQNAKLQPNEA